MNDNLILPNSMTMTMAVAIRHGFDDHPHPQRVQIGLGLPTGVSSVCKVYRGFQSSLALH